MDYLPKYQPSPYMLQRMPRQQGLLGSSFDQAQPLDQGLLAPPQMAAPISYADEPIRKLAPGERQTLDPIRGALYDGGEHITKFMQPVLDGTQKLQQQYDSFVQPVEARLNSFVQPVEDKLNSLFPQQPMSGPPASGGGDERQQMLMNFLKSMFGGK